MLLDGVARLADLWLSRGRALPDAALRARGAVSHLEPAVVVTGGTRGIGADLARVFSEGGHAVAIVARRPVAFDPGGESARRQGQARVLTIPCDVTDPSAFDRITERLQAGGMYLDVLVNNAGAGLAGPFTSHSGGEIDALLRLNIEALTRLTRLALPDMLARRRGGILNVASLGGYAPGPHQAAYYASKAYVLSLTEAIAVENAGLGVRFTVLAPGPVETGFHADMGAESSLYLALMPTIPAQRAARAAYRGFRLGQRVVVPGIFNRVALGALKILPHPISAPLVGWLLRRRS